MKVNGKWNDLLDEKLKGHILILGENQETEVISSSIEYDDSATDESDYEVGIEVENDNMLIRDLCEQNAISFSEVKEELNELIEVARK